MSPGGYIAIGFWALVALGCLYGFSFDVRRWWRGRHEPERLCDDEALAQIILFPEADRRVRQTPQRRPGA